MDRYDLNRRAWRAWQCLPRSENGSPPIVRELERKNGLANGQIHKLLKGRSRRPSMVELEKMATALGTSSEWLQFGRGQPPPARNEIAPWPGPKTPIPRPPRPKKPHLVKQAQ